MDPIYIYMYYIVYYINILFWREKSSLIQIVTVHGSHKNTTPLSQRWPLRYDNQVVEHKGLEDFHQDNAPATYRDTSPQKKADQRKHRFGWREPWEINLDLLLFEDISKMVWWRCRIKMYKEL